MLRFLLIISLCLSSIARAQGRDEPGRDEPGCDEPGDEAELWGAYERAWAATDEERRTLLARAQGAWLDYREASCEMFAARNDGPGEEAYRQCRRFMAGERMFELRLICRTGAADQDCDPPALTF